MKTKTETLLFWIAIGVMIFSLFLNNKLSRIGIGFGYVIFAFSIFPKNKKNVIRKTVSTFQSAIMLVGGLFLMLSSFNIEMMFCFIGLMMAMMIFFILIINNKWINAVIYSELWVEEVPKLIKRVQEHYDSDVKLHKENDKLRKQNAELEKRATKFKRMAMRMVTNQRLKNKIWELKNH